MFNRIIHLEETSSTNTYLKEFKNQENFSEPVVVWTDFQTTGRGQTGNTWESEKGKNLLFSFFIHPDFIEIKEQFILSQIISLAIKETLDKYTKDISIKWPNDIYWKDKKICGILIENALWENKINKSVIGVGINLNQEKFYNNALNTISLQQITGNTYNRETILKEVLSAFEQYYLMLHEKQIIYTEYMKSLYRKDGFHNFKDRNGIFSAQIIDIAPDGFLILKDTTHCIRKYAFKEVAFV